MKKFVSRLKDEIKRFFLGFGIRTTKDIGFALLIWITGPIILLLAFGQLVRQTQKPLLDLTFLTYTIGITATIICTISTVYGVWGLFFKGQSFKGHTFNGKFSIIIGARNEQ